MFCRKCGKSNQPGAAFCSSCGASLNVDVAPQPASPPPVTTTIPTPPPAPQQPVNQQPVMAPENALVLSKRKPTSAVRWLAYLVLCALVIAGIVGLFQLPFMQAEGFFSGDTYTLSYASILEVAGQLSDLFGVKISDTLNNLGDLIQDPDLFEEFLELMPWQFFVFLGVLLIAFLCVLFLLIGFVQLCRGKGVAGCRLGCTCLILLFIGDLGLISNYVELQIEWSSMVGNGSTIGDFPFLTAGVAVLTLILAIAGMALSKDHSRS